MQHIMVSAGRSWGRLFQTKYMDQDVGKAAVMKTQAWLLKVAFRTGLKMGLGGEYAIG